MSATNNISLLVSLSGAQATEANLQRVAGGIKGLGSALAGIATAVASLGVVRKALQSIANADYAGKAAQKVGVTVEEFSKLAAAARLADVDLGSLGVASRNLLEWMVKNGQTGRSLTEVLIEQADAFAGMADGAQKSALAAKLFGERAGSQMIPLLNQGSAALREQMAEMEKLGVVTAHDAAVAEEFNDSLTKFSIAQESLTRSMAMTFLPTLTRAAESITNATAALNGIVRTYPAVRTALEAVAAAAATAGLALTFSKVGGFVGMASGFAAVSKSVSVLGAAWVGWNVGAALGQMEVFSVTLNNRVQASILGTQLAWEKLKVSFGTGSLAYVNELETALARLLFKTAELVPASVRNPQTKPIVPESEDETARVKRLKDELKVERELLDVRIAEQEFMMAKTRQQGEQRGFVTQGDLISLRASNGEIERLIQSKRELTTMGKFGAEGIEPFLSEPEAQSFETKDRTDLLATDKTEQQTRFADTSVLDQLSKAAEQIQNTFGTVAVSIARAFTDIVGGAVSAVSEGISGLIKGTMTWGQALQSIGTSMVNVVIESFARMAAEWIVTHVVMEGVSWAFKGVQSMIRGAETTEEAAHAGARLAIHTGTESAMTGATIFGSIARGASRVFETIQFVTQTIVRRVAHLGSEVFMTGVSIVQTLIRVATHIAGEVASTVATTVNTGLRITEKLAESVANVINAATGAMSAMASIPYVGPFLAIAAMAAIIGAGVSVMAGGFAEGGPVAGPGSGTSDSIPAWLSNGEFVVNERAASMIGPAGMDMVNAGVLPTVAQPVPVSSGESKRDLNVNVFADLGKMRSKMLTRDREADDFFVDMFNRNRRRVNV